MCRNTVQDASCEYQMRAKIGPYGENLRPRVTVNVTIAKHNEKGPDFRRNQWRRILGSTLVEVIQWRGREGAARMWISRRRWEEWIARSTSLK